MAGPKLTVEQVREIRAAAPFKFDREWELATAEKYGVDDNTIHNIVRGMSWRDVQ